MHIPVICRSFVVYLLVVLLAVASSLEVKSQELNQRQRRERIDSALAAHYYRTSYDTNYVVRPEGKLTLKLRLNQTGNDFHAKGTVNDVSSKADLKTSHKMTLSIGASYRGISASLSINPAKMKGVYKDYELNLNYFSSRISVDFSYQRSESLAGDIYMIFNERVAIVRNFSLRYFAGVTLVMNNSVFSDDVAVVNQNKWRARAFLGMRL